MNSIKKLGVGIAVVIDLVVFAPNAHAETAFDVTECLAGTSTLVYESKEIRIGSTEGKGIIFSHHENKVFDNCTFHVVSIAICEAGQDPPRCVAGSTMSIGSRSLST